MLYDRNCTYCFPESTIVLYECITLACRINFAITIKLLIYLNFVILWVKNMSLTFSDMGKCNYLIGYRCS